jgi:hypothetical protein
MHVGAKKCCNNMGDFRARRDDVLLKREYR